MSGELEAMLRHHEGERLMPYVDTVGKITIGVGRNLTDNGITQAESDEMLAYDISVARAALVVHFTPFQTLDPVRQAALVDMAFNLGWPRLSGFKQMLAAIAAKDWTTAVAQMKSSTWAAQVGNRALDLEDLMRTGAWGVLR